MRHDEDGYLITLGELLAAAYDRLTVKPGRSIIAPGQLVAWDDCCEGQLWVRIINTVPLFQGTTNSVRCPTGYDLLLGVGIVRCVATLDNQGRPPTAANITMDGHRGARDMSELADVLGDWTARDVLTSRLGQWTPTGPEGGCAGGEWTLTARVGADL